MLIEYGEKKTTTKAKMVNKPKKFEEYKGNQEVKHTSVYDYIDTKNEGIKKVVSRQGGWLVFLDKGIKEVYNKKTGMMKSVRDKTIRHVDTEEKAFELRGIAYNIRNLGVVDELELQSKKRFKTMINEFKQSSRYVHLSENYRKHYDNYIRHFSDFFDDMEVRKITTLDIEKYFDFQTTRGNRESALTKAGKISKKIVSNSNPEGISVNTLYKHKCALVRIWNFMIANKNYGVTQNVVTNAIMPKATIKIGDMDTKVSYVTYKATTLTLEQYNYTLNDCAQHEFDRSLLLAIALGGMAGLRRSEVLALKYSKYTHDEYMDVNENIFEYTKYIKELYDKNDNLMMICEASVDSGEKLPKKEKIRVVGVPETLKRLVEYALEQRKEFYDLVGGEINGETYLYTPLMNVIKGNRADNCKLSRKWDEYEIRRNKRMEKVGLKPIPHVRFHDLRGTHSNLLKYSNIVAPWEISYNMGHSIAGSNTTTKAYWNDNEMRRDNVIKAMDDMIKIDWDKVLRKSIKDTGGRVYVDGSGHLVVSKKEEERMHKEKRKFIFKESDLEKLFMDTSEDEEN